MYARRGFSVAVHLQPDVLLVDEVLAVGDAQFQRKCLERIGELRRRGTTIVLVSHQMPTIERMCDRACLLVKGRLEAEGDPREVLARYQEVASARAARV
jgi:ABC-type polysaccharide/polyol phosphate transport system ATPase subunit